MNQPDEKKIKQPDKKRSAQDIAREIYAEINNLGSVSIISDEYNDESVKERQKERIRKIEKLKSELMDSVETPEEIVYEEKSKKQILFEAGVETVSYGKFWVVDTAIVECTDARILRNNHKFQGLDKQKIVRFQKDVAESIETFRNIKSEVMKRGYTEESDEVQKLVDKIDSAETVFAQLAFLNILLELEANIDQQKLHRSSNPSTFFNSSDRTKKISEELEAVKKQAESIITNRYDNDSIVRKNIFERIKTLEEKIKALTTPVHVMEEKRQTSPPVGPPQDDTFRLQRVRLFPQAGEDSDLVFPLGLNPSSSPVVSSNSNLLPLISDIDNGSVTVPQTLGYEAPTLKEEKKKEKVSWCDYLRNRKGLIPVAIPVAMTLCVGTLVGICELLAWDKVRGDEAEKALKILNNQEMGEHMNLTMVVLIAAAGTAILSAIFYKMYIHCCNKELDVEAERAGFLSKPSREANDPRGVTGTYPQDLSVTPFQTPATSPLPAVPVPSGRP